MLKAERQDLIRKEVLEKGFLTIRELSERIEVSEITIRRDLYELDRAGLVERIRGGVQRFNSRDHEPPIIQRQKDQIDEKREIAQRALAFIKDGDVIAIQMGTTTWELARAISKRSWKDLHIITDGIPIIEELIKVPGIKITNIGGTVNADELSNFGVLAEETLRKLSIPKLFIGCRGIQAEAGMTHTSKSESEIGTFRAFGAVSHRIIILADHSKIGQTFLMQVLPTSSIDILITTDLAPEKEIQMFKDLAVEVICVPMSSVRNKDNEIALVDSKKLDGLLADVSR